MPTTNSENIVAQINSNVFFKEFTFSKNDFKEPDTNQKLEFAENIVWPDELFFIFQIKKRGPNSNDDIQVTLPTLLFERHKSTTNDNSKN